MTVKSFKELEIWQCSVSIAIKIYSLTKCREFSRDNSLKDQMRRSAVSVGSNIAEGFGRSSKKEFIRYLRIALGSLFELETQLTISEKIGYLRSGELDELTGETSMLGKRIGALVKYLQSNTQLTNNQ